MGRSTHFPHEKPFLLIESSPVVCQHPFVQLDLDLHRAAEVPAVEPEPKILTVTELTRTVRSLLEGRIGEVWVEGEISNLRKQASGHSYFTLKDQTSQVPCVLFAGAASGMRGLRLTDGQHVQIFGQMTVYEARGAYQIIVRLVQAVGEGALQAKFEALKRLLAAEGLFEADRKLPLPRFPKRVGVVTSPTGAALRDFLKVLHRRHPGIEVLINPVRVQGTGACREIARAIQEFGDPERYGLPAVDVIVVTRGGGSIEDLWEFNEEVVARAIAASSVPVLSAIGHEIDFTISDFVADLRAPTPSAAAEILAADRQEVLGYLSQQERRLHHTTRSRLEFLEAKVAALANSSGLREPARRLLDLRQSLDRHASTLDRSSQHGLERAQSNLHRLTMQMERLAPTVAVEQARSRIHMLGQKLSDGLDRELSRQRARLERASGVLAALNPENTLARGFTITMDAQGRALTKAADVRPGMILKTRFADGEVESTSTEPLTPSGSTDNKETT